MFELYSKLLFIIKYKILKKAQSWCYRLYLRSLGVSIGHGTMISKAYFSWYHKVKIGFESTIEHHVFFKHDGAYSSGHSIIIGNKTFIGNGCEFNITDKITIGDYCAIASGCKFIDHNHGFSTREMLMCHQDPLMSPITIDDDVWLGVNVVVLKGVHIGKGVIVAAGAVVNKSIPPYEIWGGIPAKKITTRPHENQRLPTNAHHNKPVDIVA